jgi:hypothetical protein
LAPLEPYEKIFVSKHFLESDHGQIGCPNCHGGDPSSHDWQSAHVGLTKDPSFPDPQQTCGDCHPEISTSAVESLHWTIAPIGRSIERRMGVVDQPTRQALAQANQNHCSQCHASCGQCHISRPSYMDGGFLAQHKFQKKPPMETTCASCHGGRIFAEFTGLNTGVKADVHFAKADMTCVDCHKADQIHAASKDVVSRFEASSHPRCKDCHADAAEGRDSEIHGTHSATVACQVCHALPIKNCFGCHVGTDKKGLPYYKCRQTVLGIKIGLSPGPSPAQPSTYVVLRHAPIAPDTFDHYAPNALKAFASVPTWKQSAPHTIQRRTPQNIRCNGCHGNRDLFLGPADLTPQEVDANYGVVVPAEKLPARIASAPN